MKIKTICSLVIAGMLLCGLAGSAPVAERTYYGDLPVEGNWQIDETSPLSMELPGKKILPADIKIAPSRTYFVHSGALDKDQKGRISYGGALNLKYYSGISYDYIQKNIPGKTVSIDIHIPEEAIIPDNPIPNRLRVVMKSETDGEWADFYDKSEFINTRKAGTYHVEMEIPEEVVSRYEDQVFNPENSILFLIEYYFMEGAKHFPFLSFSFNNFDIEGIDLDPASLKWQMTKNGYAIENVYLPSFVKGSTIISHMGGGLDLDFTPKISPAAGADDPLTGNLENFFLSFSAFVPKELRQQKGTFALTIRDNKGNVRSSVKNFDSCNLEGRVYLTLPLDIFSGYESLQDLIDSSQFTLRIKTLDPHTANMLPIVLEPMKIRQGRLIPFDDEWRLRDVQGLGGYREIDVRPDGKISEGGLTVQKMREDLYQLDATIRMKGGIDWENPYYKVELVRELGDEPVDLDNMHLEVLMSPLTDTTDVWQRPFRARIGIMDNKGNIMFGPNISLSEGLPSLAQLDVSLTNPMPKGLVMPGFDPKSVTSVVLNFEASHGPTEIRDIKVSLVNLAISPREYTRPAGVKNIDFGRFKRDPASWQITRIVREAGGYFVGLNYPFTVLDISEAVLKVPQVYPAVGMKPTDPRHLGLSSDMTKKTTLEDFTLFSNHRIDMVRLFMLGHLEGVFTWDEKGRDILGFGEGMEKTLQEMAGMSVERLAEYLNANEQALFSANGSGELPGVEKHVLRDFRALFDILEQVEKDTGRRLYVILSLFDFLLGDNVKNEGPLRMYTVGEHSEAVTDPIIKTKVLALTWKIMKIMSQDERFSRYVAVAEIMNEPANATGLATRKNFPDLVNFVGEGLYLLKDAIGPSIPVSVGFRSWPEDLRYWAPIAGGVDVLMIHYWESLESYNIDVEGLWPIDMSTRKLWKYLGQKPEGRPVGMGEIGPKDLEKNLFRLEKAGYDFTLLWSYSGHDSYNVKPFMENVKRYQKANYEFGRLMELPLEDLKKTFLYFLTARQLFDAQWEKITQTTTTNIDDSFRLYMENRAKNITSPVLSRSVEGLLEVSRLKNIPLNSANIRYLMLKTIREKTIENK
ncbi:MAG: hypothetical protein GF409_07135 [Candidatus Omnitrophica bacterium]|nr:hypothetical protein [Candidatus Omnitrophota bacterium]